MAKLKLKFGTAQFSGNGEPEWLVDMADKFLKKLNELPIQKTFEEFAPRRVKETVKTTQTPSLKKYLEDRNGLKNQTEKFLVTAAWLLKRGQKEMSTKVVNKALKDNHQSRLTNASECLNQNISKGYCEKNGNSFFITPEGYSHIGEDNNADANTESISSPNIHGSYDLSIESIAAKMGVSSATDLAKAAGIYLKLVKNNSEFDRSDILSTMKLATAYYKDTMNNNLTTTINSLIKAGAFLKRSSGKYAVSIKLETEGRATLDTIN